MTRRFHISAISYLNTAPLMWDFLHGQAAEEFDISYTIPSACAAALRQGTADIGIIPAAAYTGIADLQIIPGVAIAARRAVRSILLVSKVPLEKIYSVALDTSSMTSVVLTKVLFAKWFKGNRVFTPMPPDLDSMLQGHDAALVIGDPALQIDRSKYITFDLAEEWISLTGMPFVFAFWAVRKAALEQNSIALDLPEIFQKSRDHGLEAASLRQIAEEWAPRLELTQTDIHRYLTQSIHYYLDPECLEGMQLFYRYAAECGALPEIKSLGFLEAARPVTT